ncbi:hypothetical protein [Methylobacterium sp. NEAU K]|uniref:hypothetical protein n=1 Tax=Methylobacterium sp. NEAU K TaxID=3064946 RepID=UPI0027331767|nr:hypothetical protein [Methylobacterium sp. NEAU K]MDP4002128.1 hypothetical protein [Methylobacterium sp. NEAU K]
MISGAANLLDLPKLSWGEAGANVAPAWIFVPNGAPYLMLAVLSGRPRRLRPDSGDIRLRVLGTEIRLHLRPRGGAPPAVSTRCRSSPT